MNQFPISAVIIARNEEERIQRTIRSIEGLVSDVVVIDDNSTDQTAEVSLKLGARVFQRALNSNFSAQRNYGAEKASHDWILVIDADEFLPPKTVESLRGRFDQLGMSDAASLRIINVLMDAPLYYSSGNCRTVRFYRKSVSRFEGNVHEKLVGSDRVLALDGEIWNYPGKSIDEQFAKSIRYSAVEAREYIAANYVTEKEIHYQLTWKSLKRFFKHYIRRKGYKDGIAGLAWSIMNTLGPQIRWLKIWEEAVRQNKLISADSEKITKHGVRFRAKRRNDLFWRNVRKAKWENSTFRIFRDFIRRDKTYLDIGAWIGPTVLFGGHLAGRCYAVEPDPVAAAELEANLALNPLIARKVTLFKGCIWATSGKVRLGSQENFGDSQSSVLLADKKGSVEVDALSFSDFVKRFDIKDVAFIKMDIEGGEATVLPTMADYLVAHRPVIFLSLHQGWFKDRQADCGRIISTLQKAYAHLYLRDGSEITFEQLDKIMAENDIAEIVATAKPWPLFKRLRQRFTEKWKI